MAEQSTRKLSRATIEGPRFVVVYPPAGVPTRHVVTLGEITMGRAPTCDVVIEHDTISRRHAKLHVEVDRVFVEDLESANGTSLRGQPIAPGTRVLVPLGAMMSLGDVIVLLRAGPDDAPESEDAGPMEACDRVIDLVAPTPLPVLILGETGAGKEVVAERIVAKSTRAKQPFVRVNCAALSETLVESELFGHEKGAFTGADRAKQGLLEAADGGTMLLDEVAELPLAAQAKLLRVLESGETARVGSVTTKRVDVRFIAATNRDLADMVDRGAFREDLLYRLDGVTIRVAPLRERPKEILPLARALLASACETMNRKPPALAEDAATLLSSYDWPGNIRELRRVMERVAALFHGATVRGADLTSLLASGASKSARPPPASSMPEAVKLEVDAIERARIEDALRRAAGNQTKAAKLLGISRRTLVDRLERFGMPRPRKT